MTDYRAFLEAKVKLDHGCGFDVDPRELNPALKDHTQAMVRWALAGGRRALFAAFGLHKTCAQLEAMRLIGVHRPGIRLITLPLGVRQEFFRDARERFSGEYSIALKFIRRADEVEDERTIYLTNYESVREGILDVAALKPVAVSLDEASNGYADLPVEKEKSRYTRARWQYDAHGFTRSSGNRLLQPEDLDGLAAEAVYKRFRQYSLSNVYDFQRDLAIAEHADSAGCLPSTFMLLPPASWHPDVWTDVARMRTLNSTQAQKGKEMHLCPLQFDIVDRLIEQFSMAGEVVLDPFAGLGTVPFCAVKQGRHGYGIELNDRYCKDAIWYLQAAEQQRATPSLFDLEEAA